MGQVLTCITRLLYHIYEYLRTLRRRPYRRPQPQAESHTQTQSPMDLELQLEVASQMDLQLEVDRSNSLGVGETIPSEAELANKGVVVVSDTTYGDIRITEINIAPSEAEEEENSIHGAEMPSSSPQLGRVTQENDGARDNPNTEDGDPDIDIISPYLITTPEFLADSEHPDLASLRLEDIPVLEGISPPATPLTTPFLPPFTPISTSPSARTTYAPRPSRETSLDRLLDRVTGYESPPRAPDTHALSPRDVLFGPSTHDAIPSHPPATSPFATPPRANVALPASCREQTSPPSINARSARETAPGHSSMASKAKTYDFDGSEEPQDTQPPLNTQPPRKRPRAKEEATLEIMGKSKSKDKGKGKAKSTSAFSPTITAQDPDLSTLDAYSHARGAAAHPERPGLLSSKRPASSKRRRVGFSPTTLETEEEEDDDDEEEEGEESSDSDTETVLFLRGIPLDPHNPDHVPYRAGASTGYAFREKWSRVSKQPRGDGRKVGKTEEAVRDQIRWDAAKYSSYGSGLRRQQRVVRRGREVVRGKEEDEKEALERILKRTVDGDSAGMELSDRERRRQQRMAMYDYESEGGL